ncbi:MAG TPA: hypothetical protein VL197_16015 [Nitrospirota bacterium]|nr:hypothetical protein [Nitrospirota bacterium]
MKELIKGRAMNEKSGCDAVPFRALVGQDWLAHRLLPVMMILSLVLMWSSLQTSFGQDRVVKAEGIVTAVADEAVFIDRRGYIINRTTKVFDVNGKRVKMDDLQYPVKVKYEYLYTDKGPLVQVLRAVGQ